MENNAKVVVAGHWEIGYMTPIMEANFWNLVLRDFQVDGWMMCPVTGIKHNEDYRLDLDEFDSYENMLASCDHLQRVFVEPRTRHQNPNTTWLHEFEHPESCVYIFGSAHYNPTIINKREQDAVVSIKTVENKGVLWSNQCLAIVLYDRMLKSGSNNIR
jgi:hypothetical protein